MLTFIFAADKIEQHYFRNDQVTLRKIKTYYVMLISWKEISLQLRKGCML